MKFGVTTPLVLGQATLVFVAARPHPTMRSSRVILATDTLFQKYQLTATVKPSHFCNNVLRSVRTLSNERKAAGMPPTARFARSSNQLPASHQRVADCCSSHLILPVSINVAHSNNLYSPFAHVITCLYRSRVQASVHVAAG